MLGGVLVAIEAQRTGLAGHAFELVQLQDEIDDLLHGAMVSDERADSMGRPPEATEGALDGKPDQSVQVAVRGTPQRLDNTSVPR